MIKRSFSIFVNLLLCLLLAGSATAQNGDASQVAACLQGLTEVMIHDITSPLVAGRDYAYTMIAFYEGARNADSSHYKSFSGQLNGLGQMPEPVAGLRYDWLTTGTTAFYETAYSLVFSKDIFQQSRLQMEHKLKKRYIKPEVYARSVALGKQIASFVLAWAKEDNYIHTRTLARYTPSDKAGSWKPTAPDYMEAIEPYWNQIRPMVLKKPDEIEIPAPALYQSEKFKTEC